MNDLEKILASLPRPKLSLRADIKIKFKLYYLIFLKRAEKIFSHSAPRGYGQILKNSLIAASIIIIMSGGACIYAYSSNRVIPGTRLYLLKRAVENMEQRVSFSPAARIQTYQKFSQRRLEEALRLSRQNFAAGQTVNANQSQASANIQKTIDEAMSNLLSAAISAEAISVQASAQTAKNQLIQYADSGERYLDEIAAMADSAADQEILAKVSQAKTVINKYQNQAVPASNNGQLKQSEEKEEKEEKDRGQTEEKRDTPKPRRLEINYNKQKNSGWQVKSIKIGRDGEEHSAPIATTSPSNVWIKPEQKYEIKKIEDNKEDDEKEIRLPEPEDSDSAEQEPAQEISPSNTTTTTPPRAENNHEESEESDEKKVSDSSATPAPAPSQSTVKNRESENKESDD